MSIPVPVVTFTFTDLGSAETAMNLVSHRVQASSCRRQTARRIDDFRLTIEHRSYARRQATCIRLSATGDLQIQLQVHGSGDGVGTIRRDLAEAELPVESDCVF